MLMFFSLQKHSEGDQVSETLNNINTSRLYITFKLLSREDGELIDSVHSRLLRTPRVRVEKSLALQRVLIYGQK